MTMRDDALDMDLVNEDVFNEHLRMAIIEHWGIRPEDVKLIKVPIEAYQMKAALLTDNPLMPIRPPTWVDRPGIRGRIARWLGKLLGRPLWGKKAKYSPVEFLEEIIKLEVCQIGMWEIHVGYGAFSNVLALSDRKRIDRSRPAKKLTIEDVNEMFDQLAAALVPDDADGE